MSRWPLYAGIALASSAVTALATSLILPAQGGEAVRDYLLAHPEVIPEAMERLRAKEAAGRIAGNRRALEAPFAGAWIGAERPDVTLVQFFDYACGFCRASLPDIQRLVREDPKLRVVFRELPILSPGSEAGARASLGAAVRGRYARFHDALYAAGRPDSATIAAAARAAGLDPADLARVGATPAVTAELSRNIELARSLGVTGTPAWVVGDQTLSGAVGYAALKKAITDARAARTQPAARPG